MSIASHQAESEEALEPYLPPRFTLASSEPLDIPLEAIVAEVQEVFAPIECELAGFGPLLTQAIYALLTGENLLVFSPPGTAKTLFARLLFRRISGARVFDTQLSKGTLAEELFGSVDIEQMKTGRVIHNTRGTLVDADLAFIDEFFDANDMVLRALLGIFHERVFKKGSQTQPASLHTGIAAANYVRATGVTQAVVDRFLFRATIAPAYDPFTLLSIDHAFARHHGDCAASDSSSAADERRLPLAHLTYLKEIVSGRVPEHQITAPPHVLFMKNVLINRYRHLMAQHRVATDSDEPAPYISPRTYAKSRVLLNAAALLRGHRQVTCDDLSQLKYVITTIGGDPEESRSFDDALRWTLMTIRDAEREQVDRLAAAEQLAEQILHRFRTGERISCTRFLQRLLRLFGLISEGDVTFDHVRRFVEDVKPRVDEVKLLKQGLIGRLQEFKNRVDYHQGYLIH